MMIDHDALSAADFSQPEVGVTACPSQGLCRDFSRSLERSA